jgi:hypothetical protein
METKARWHLKKGGTATKSIATHDTGENYEIVSPLNKQTTIECIAYKALEGQRIDVEGYLTIVTNNIMIIIYKFIITISSDISDDSHGKKSARHTPFHPVGDKNTASIDDAHTRDDKKN